MRTTSSLAALLSTLGLLATAGVVAGQTQSTRSGFWASVGAGGGSALVSCPICSDERRAGASGFLRAGASLSPALRIGAEATLMRSSLEEATQVLGSAFLIGIAYPKADGRLYLKAGAGLSRLEARPNDPEDDDDVADTYGLTVGIGYDYPVRSGVSLSPYLNLVATSFGTLRRNEDALAADLNVTLVQFGLAITAH